MRALAGLAARRPWLARLATRVLTLSPSIERRIRRLLSTSRPIKPYETATPARHEVSLSAAEARVLMDLRDALMSGKRHH